jgi:hypothetical protein
MPSDQAQKEAAIQHATTERRAKTLAKDAPLLALKEAFAAAFQAAGQHETAEKLRKCCTHELLVCCADCRRSWWVTYHCKLRCCPICARNKSRDRLKLLKAVTKCQSSTKMLTLTMRRWDGDPREGIKHLRASMQRFRDSALMKTCKGGAYTIELLPKENGWHIHAHLLIDSGYLPFRRVLKVWTACCRQSTSHVRIQAATRERVKAYVCKYACKTGLGTLGAHGADKDGKGIGPESIVDWFAAVRGSRLWGTFGAWYRFSQQDIAEALELETHVSSCPFCGAIHTIFQARSGVFVFGGEWRSLAWHFGADGETERPIHGPPVDTIAA